MLDGLIVSLLLLGAGSSSGELPFWATANQFGLMPQYNGAMARLNAHTEFDESKTFQWRAGLSYAGNAQVENGNGTLCGAGILDEFYGSCRWKMFTVDLGIKHRDRDFLAAGDDALGSLSATSGNLAWSSNTRSLPGYSITLSPLAVPFTGGHFCIYGRYGDYKMLDTRYVQGALLHNMQVGLLFHIGERLDFRLALDHYAYWGGVNPTEGEMPVTFENYLRMATGRSAAQSSNADARDKVNVLGDQRGAELLRFDWRGDGWTATFQHDIPYDDGSGMGFQNFPDGVNTLHFGWNDKNRWVSDILCEYGYTLWQSGTWHDDLVDGKIVVLGGLDNYFNHEGYQSGWTYFGRTIGLPLFYPKGTRDGSWRQGGLTLGVENNRFSFWHFGISGRLFRTAPYKLLFTMSSNYGTYPEPYDGESQRYRQWGTVRETPVRQFSSAFAGEVPAAFGLERITLHYGLYADFGKVLRNCFGATLGIGVKIY